MSSYTITIKEILEMWTHNTASSTSDRIEKGRQKLFDFDYPIFDSAYKSVFETHFIRKFYMREIGFETEGLFKFQLETWLQINMPYFNNLFKSELITYDPLQNSNLSVKTDKTKNQTATNTSTGNSNASGTSATTSFDRGLDSDNPDTRLEITTENGAGVIEYASRISENTENNNQNSSTSANSTSNSSGTANDIEDYLESRIGKTGNDTYSKMLNEYRSTFIRIENKIFDEMQELFMLVY